MSASTAIQVQGLWKSYGIPLGHQVRQWLRPQRASDLQWSLQDLNFEVIQGESLGIIGYNGAGKSTLLKTLAGVTPPTRGKINVLGRIFPMIELNAGMNSELTGRENVHLLGAIMGIPNRDLEVKMPTIEAFCELGDWFDRPVWQYSSGMMARLGFAVALNAEADILLIDEVLAVGDIAFQRKSLDRMEQMQQSGKTILFVSHSIRQVERLCNRVLLLDKGKQVAIGPSAQVIAEYYDTANTKILEHYTAEGEKVSVLSEKAPNSIVDLQEVSLRDGQGQLCANFSTNDAFTIDIEYLSHETFEDVIIGLAILTVDSLYITNFEHVIEGGIQKGTGRLTCNVETLPLLKGIYIVQCKILRSTGAILGGGRGLATFSISTPAEVNPSPYGIIHMPARWQHQPD